mmetsp:Transcript_29479/g.36574  ORF Transcript_29479/g.36574 Transcript_29479/m.36574 type:complete len:104 (-) Transcript_29479:434-745(-)
MDNFGKASTVVTNELPPNEEPTSPASDPGKPDGEVAASTKQTREAIIARFKQECARVRDGCNFDISKCFKDGKPLIIDGSHIDPECYLRMERNEQTGKMEYRI